MNLPSEVVTKKSAPWEETVLGPKGGKPHSRLSPSSGPRGLSKLRDLKKKYSHCLWFLKFSHLLNVVHEVPAIDVFHDEIQPVLKTKVQHVSRAWPLAKRLPSLFLGCVLLSH